jgi:hypothetical protein
LPNRRKISVVHAFRRLIATSLAVAGGTRKADEPKRLDVYSLARGYRTQAGRQAACRARRT